MTDLELSDDERQLIQIMREWDKEDEYQLEIRHESGAWEIKLSELGAKKYARGVGRTFAEAWNNMAPSWL